MNAREILVHAENPARLPELEITSARAAGTGGGRRLVQETLTDRLFTICWPVV